MSAPKKARLTKQEFVAVKALCKGEATPSQQRIALDWIMQKAAGIGDALMDTDGHMTAFNCGKRFVAIQIAAVGQTPGAAMDLLPDNPESMNG